MQSNEQGMSYETLTYAVTDGVALITLNRPQARNAVNSVMSRELPLLWRQFENDAQARVAILTGAGDKALSTGADLSDLPQTDGDGMEGSLQSIRWTSLQNQVWKPVICAVNGMAVGGGLHFVADSDIVIAADNATFFDTHVKVGLVAGLEPVSLARKMPLESVLRMVLMGGSERLSASAAHQLGLVGEVVPAEQLLPRARELADLIKQHSPAAMARSKRAIWEGADRGLQDGLEHAWDIIMQHNSHPDIAEGGQAFVEQRPPQWRDYSEIES
ncbi:enoyl-CoA hydratase/isomerase family protein [Halieaceae bacterium IMCC14734]|uniref:Enoyl-CoA hydratase/isomerase family protein n=1 Tax=Candidatus Litorirhabdus singularis TaxID=2518993 RepID=A0ABT3TJR5_9GAMM|nr:enoyl-CoA hydratase-related protein [Candidatus Litorirhabdus singularis]MCX2982555.1 enoyl-CoA hydratase/isomerase family protein [Candidatus Litorirhabdus singularis]